MVKNYTKCGQCTKSSCKGCNNYIAGKAQQTPTAQIIVTEAVKALGVFFLLALLLIII